MTTKQLICLLIGVLCINSARAQYNMQRHLTDVNLDGHTDTVQTFYDGGSGFGGTYGEIIDGASGKKYEMDLWSCFCDSWLIRALPSDYDLPENKPFYDTLIQRLFGDFMEEPDPSMKWIMHAHFNFTAPDSNSVYDKVFHIPFIWHSLPDSFNYSYSVRIGAEDLKKYYRTYSEKPNWLSESDQGLIKKYNGHLKPKRIIDWGEDRLLIAQQGIMIQRTDGKVSWLFVTDPYTTGGPEKMRWDGINEVYMMEDLLIFELSLAPALNKYIYVFHPKSGYLGRLRQIIEKEVEWSQTSMVVQHKTLELSSGDIHEKYSYDYLIMKLKEAYESPK